MSSNYRGIASNIGSFPAPLTLSAAADGGATTGGYLINLTTSTVHGLVTGDTVTITGSSAAPGFNGTYTIAYISTTQFSIVVAAELTGYVGGGSVQPIVFPFEAVPSDGDALDAASVDTPVEANSDRLVALLATTGARKLAYVYFDDQYPNGSLSDASLMSYWYTVAGTSLSTSAWTALYAASGQTTVRGSTTWPYTGNLGNAPGGAAINVDPGDIVEVTFDGVLGYETTAAGQAVGLAFQVDFTGSTSPMLPSSKTFSAPVDTSGSIYAVPVALESRFQAPAGASSMSINLMAILNDTSLSPVRLLEGYVFTLKIWRLTGTPQ